MKNSDFEDKLQERRDLTFAVELNESKFVPVPPFPREIVIDINNRCNHRCYFCANPKIEKYAALDTDIVYDLMRQGIENGSTDLSFHALGDPFMDKRIVEFIDKSKKLGYEYVYIDTNGALVNQEKARAIADAGLDSIKFSISAANRDDYKAVHGKDDFDKVIENLKYLYQYRNENNINLGIYVSCVVNSKSKVGTDSFKNLISENCDHFAYRDISNQGGSMIELNDTETIEIGNILGTLQKEEQTGECVYPFNRIVINSYGHVVSCTADFLNQLSIGDATKYSLEEIWKGDVYKYLRDKHLNGNLSGIYCDKCVNNCNSKTTSLIDSFNANQ